MKGLKGSKQNKQKIRTTKCVHHEGHEECEGFKITAKIIFTMKFMKHRKVKITPCSKPNAKVAARPFSL
jgi:hypothetical protein